MPVEEVALGMIFLIGRWPPLKLELWAPHNLSTRLLLNESSCDASALEIEDVQKRTLSHQWQFHELIK